MSQWMTKTRFIIECSEEQREVIEDALQAICEGFDDDIEMMKGIENADGTLTYQQQIVMEAVRLFSDGEPVDSSTLEDAFVFSTQKCAEGLLITNDETIDLDAATSFTHAVMKTFELPGVIFVEAVSTGYNTNDGQGCGYCITKDRITYSSPEELFQAESEAAEKSVLYYACSVVRRIGDDKVKEHFLIESQSDRDASAFFMSIFSDKPHKDKNDWSFELDDGVDVGDPVIEQVEPLAFTILKQHLPVYENTLLSNA